MNYIKKHNNEIDILRLKTLATLYRQAAAKSVQLRKIFEKLVREDPDTRDEDVMTSLNRFLALNNEIKMQLDILFAKDDEDE